MKRGSGVSIRQMKALADYSRSEHDKYVRLERRELRLMITEILSRRSESKKLRLVRNKQRKQIDNLVAKLSI